MRLVAPSQVALRRQFQIGKGPSESGPRLGGRAPLLGHPPSLREVARYVATFPFGEEPELFVSVFVNCSFEDLLRAMNKPVQCDDRIVAVLHESVPRSSDHSFASELSEHPLVIAKKSVPDLVKNDLGQKAIAAGHKLGGRPFCIQEPELKGAKELYTQGYRQAVQLDFPSAQDEIVSGNWPFADGLFNLFLRTDGTGPAYWACQM